MLCFASKYLFLVLVSAERELPVVPDSDVDVEDLPVVDEGEGEGAVGSAVLGLPDQEGAVPTVCNDDQQGAMTFRLLSIRLLANHQLMVELANKSRIITCLLKSQNGPL